MKPLSKLALCAFLAVPFLSSCVVDLGSTRVFGADWVGSGVASKQGRTLGVFSKIEMRGGLDLEVTVGPATSLELEADDNLLERIETRVEGDELVIEMQPGSYDFKVQPRARIQTPSLTRLSISGSSDADVRGLSGGEFGVSISGSGDVRASGRVDRLTLAIAGSGDLDLFELAAQHAEVSISGSGDVEVNASESLRARISGSGDVRYKGKPDVKTSVSGSGDVGPAN